MPIYKYPLATLGSRADAVVVEMPAGAKILTLKLLDDQVCIWADVTLGAPTVIREFYIVPTGSTYESPQDTYLQTIFMRPYVWHVYEKKNPKAEKESPVGRRSRVAKRLLDSVLEEFGDRKGLKHILESIENSDPDTWSDLIAANVARLELILAEEQV